MRTLYILFTLLIILLSPFLSLATSDDGSQVKTIDKDGSVVKVGGEVNKSSVDESVNYSTGSNAPSTIAPNTANLVAGQAMIENAGKNLSYWFGDSLRESALSIASTDVNQSVTGPKTPRYTLYSKEIKPFSAPNVWIFLMICAAFHLFASMFFIFLGISVFVAGTIWPKEVGNIRAGLSGEYTQFDVKAYLLVCGCVMLLPLIDAFGIWYSVLFRNGLATFMNNQMVDVLNIASNDIINKIVFSLTLYVNYLEKALGEYTVYVMTSFIFIKTWVTAFILLFGSLKQAAVLHFTVMIGFLLVLLMDIQTLLFISYGVAFSVWKNNPVYSLAGMIVGGLIDGLILAIIFLIPALIVYRKVNRSLYGL
jgi:hypothetical protein